MPLPSRPAFGRVRSLCLPVAEKLWIRGKSRQLRGSGTAPNRSFHLERCNFQRKIAMYASADLHTIDATVTSIT
jgi:hypothetical protein